MDSAGNIAVGYTRTGSQAPNYPSIYYSGRRASDALGTMPYYDNLIWNATTSKTNNERWGDYSGIGVDPSDGCTFWYTTEYGGSGQTRVAAFKFDECGTPDFHPGRIAGRAERLRPAGGRLHGGAWPSCHRVYPTVTLASTRFAG